MSPDRVDLPQPGSEAAHHEAGHAVAAWRLGVPIEYVTLRDWVMGDPITQLLDRDDPADRDIAEKWAIKSFAGGIVEERFTGEPSTGSDHDRRQAAEVVKPFTSSVDEHEALLASLEAQAATLVEDHYAMIEALACRLIELCATSGDPYHQMAGDDVDGFLNGLQP